MAVADLDPIFLKALKLLNSKSKDSAAQLKAMAEELIAQRKGLKVPVQSGDAGKMSPARSKVDRDDDYKRKDTEKRPHEKGTKDASESDPKKSKSESSKHRNKDEKEARDKEREREKEKARRERKEKEEKEAQRQKEKAERERKEKLKQETEVMTISDDDTSSQLDAGDLALEWDITCGVCKQFGVRPGNQLVECQECHNLYHQECHKPPISDPDPRTVWYCSRCQKVLQKKQQAAQKPVIKPSKPSSLISGKEGGSSAYSSSKSFKPDTTISSSSSSAFRKIDPKTIVPTKDIPKDSSGSQNKPILGLAALAANLAKPQSKSGQLHRKGDQKDSSSKQQSHLDSKSSSSSSKHKNEEKRPEKSATSDKERKHESSSKVSSNANRDEKKPTEFSSKGLTSSSHHTSEKSERKSSLDLSSKSEKKVSVSDFHRSTSLSGLKQEANVGSGSVNVGADSSDSAAGSDKNKIAVANLSMITAKKRDQMMKKKAQAKPTDKKVHTK